MSAAWSMPSARICGQASSRNRTRPGSWTAVIGSSPCSVGPTISNPPSAARAAWIRSARSTTSFAGIDLAHVRLGHDVVAPVKRRIDDAHATSGAGPPRTRRPNGTQPAALVEGQDGGRDGGGPVAHEVVAGHPEVDDRDR